MNIGKRVLSDAEFELHVGAIVRQAERLARGLPCSGASMASACYVVLTSAPGDAAKLHNRLSDFLYYVAKQKRGEIAGARDWLTAYGREFVHFAYVSEKLDGACFMLSGATEGGLRDAAHAVWERAVSSGLRERHGRDVRAELLRHAVDGHPALVACLLSLRWAPGGYAAYEVPALSLVEAHWRRHTTFLSVEALVGTAAALLTDADARAEHAFLPESRDKLRTLAETVAFVPHAILIHRGVRAALREGPGQVARWVSTLAPHTNAFSVLVQAALSEHVGESLSAAATRLDRCASNSRAVTRLYAEITSARRMSHTVFPGDDTLVRTAFIASSKLFVAVSLSERLARFVNGCVRTGDAGHADVFAFFAAYSRTDIGLFRPYADSLCGRLLVGADLTRERAFIARAIPALHRAQAEKLETMVRDIEKSIALHSEFLESLTPRGEYEKLRMYVRLNPHEFPSELSKLCLDDDLELNDQGVFINKRVVKHAGIQAQIDNSNIKGPRNPNVGPTQNEMHSHDILAANLGVGNNGGRICGMNMSYPNDTAMSRLDHVLGSTNTHGADISNLNQFSKIVSTDENRALSSILGPPHAFHDNIRNSQAPSPFDNYTTPLERLNDHFYTHSNATGSENTPKCTDSTTQPNRESAFLNGNYNNGTDGCSLQSTNSDSIDAISSSTYEWNSHNGSENIRSFAQNIHSTPNSHRFENNHVSNTAREDVCGNMKSSRWKNMLRYINSCFRSNKREQSPKHLPEMRTLVLKRCAWPIDLETQFTDIILPREVLSHVGKFTDFYYEKYPKRKLVYNHDVSIVKCNVNTDRSYTFILNTYQYLILRQFEITSNQSIQTIYANTKIPYNSILNILKDFEDLGILKIYDADVAFVDSFTSSKVELNISMKKYYRQAFNENEFDLKTFYKAKLASNLKHKKTMTRKEAIDFITSLKVDHNFSRETFDAALEELRKNDIVLINNDIIEYDL